MDNIKNISKNYIEFDNGEKYFHEDYVIEMNRRNYEKGLQEGRQVVIHKVVIEPFHGFAERAVGH